MMRHNQTGTGPDTDGFRRRAMKVLAGAGGDDVRLAWEAAGIDVDAQPVRGPETGLVTVRGRMGGGGAPFNVGEATVTRATVRLADGTVGHAYALGRDADKVRLAAIIDALVQTPGRRGLVEDAILAPLERMAAETNLRRREETEATRVDFFTMVRGED